MTKLLEKMFYFSGARQIRALKVRCDGLDNGCHWVGQLDYLEEHLDTCLYVTVPCKYAEVGCKETLLRRDLQPHEEDDQLHLRVTTETVLDQNKKITTLMKRTATSPFTFRLTNYQKHKRAGDVFYSPPFYTSPTGYKMCICVYANGSGDGQGTHVSVFACLMKGDNDDSLTWPFTGTVTIKLLNQLEDTNHTHTTRPFPADSVASKRVVKGEKETGRGNSQFIPHNSLDCNRYKNCQYLKNDTLIFRVSVQVPDYKPWLECTV